MNKDMELSKCGFSLMEENECIINFAKGILKKHMTANPPAYIVKMMFAGVFP